MFGGNSGDLNDGGNPQGQYLNDTVVLETGTNTWTRPATLGSIPTERGETQIVYDSRGDNAIKSTEVQIIISASLVIIVRLSSRAVWWLGQQVVWGNFCLQGQ